MLGGTGAFVPFFALHLGAVGVGAAAAGAMLAATSLVQTIATPIVGHLADRSGARARLMLALLLASVLAVGGFAAARSPWTALATLALIAAVRAPATVLMDAEVVHSLEAAGRPPETYGRLRLWGSIGFLVLANVGGLLAADAPWRAVALSAAMLGLTTLLATRLPGARVPVDARPVSAIGAFRADPVLLVLALAAILHGTGQFVYDVFLSTLLARTGMPIGATGPAVAVAVMSEVAVMAAARPLLRKVEPLRLVALASAVMAVRLLATSVAPTVPVLVAIQALHGLGFGLWWVALVESVRRRTPISARSGSQALVVAGAYGVGPMLGSLLGGLLLDTAGPRALFQAGAAAVALGACTAGVAALRARQTAPPPVLL